MMPKLSTTPRCLIDAASVNGPDFEIVRSGTAKLNVWHLQSQHIGDRRDSLIIPYASRDAALDAASSLWKRSRVPTMIFGPNGEVISRDEIERLLSEQLERDEGGQ